MEIGPIQFAGGSVLTRSAQDYGGPVTLLTNGPIGTSSNRIQFADDANTAQQIVSIGSATVQPSSVYLDGLGSLTLGGILGGGTNPTIDVTAQTKLVFSAAVDGDLVLVVATQGATEFDAAMSVESLNVEAGSTQIDGGSIATVSTQNYAGAVTISRETTLTSTGTGTAGAITLGSTVDGSGGLDTLHVITAGMTDFKGAVGGSASSPDMEALDVEIGPIQLEGGSVSTRSAEYYGGPVTITQNTTLSSTAGGYVSFNSPIDSSGGLFTLHSITAGLTRFHGAVGGSGNSPDMEALDVEIGPIQFAGGSVLTRSAQDYGGPVTLLENTTLTSTAGGYIAFNSTIDAGSNPAGLTITTSHAYTNVSGTIQLFHAAIGGNTPLSYLVANVEGGIALNTPIVTYGDMLFGGAALMPAVLQVSADLTSYEGTIGFDVSQSVYTGFGSTISAFGGPISFSAGANATGSSLVSLFSPMQATGVFVSGNGASNQLVLPPPGQ
ncbi:MAG TPA: hypothetical protein VIK18_18350, partial [Pirellulales bacterium]